MANFEIDGSRWLLTWPQSEALETINIQQYLLSLGEIEYMVICSEYHQIQGSHHHAVVLFKKRLKKTYNCFNIDIYNCNVKKLKTQADVKRAVKYVKKDGSLLIYGNEPEYMKKLTKGEKVEFALNNSLKKCLNSGYYSFSELTRIQQIKNMNLDKWPFFAKRVVHWYCGETGTGKTRTAMEKLSECYSRQDIWISSGKIDPFLIGYNGQRAVVLDDFRPGFCRFELLLRLLDGYPVYVNVKGGQCEWLAEVIIITAPVEPNEMFINRETGQEWDHLDQLKRRIDEIKFFYKQ